MKLRNTPTKDGSSYEQPKPGKYLGVVIGVSNLGVQPGNGQYAPQQQVMIRHALYRRKKSGEMVASMDKDDFIHAVVTTFGATVRGENSRLRKALEAHGIDVPLNGETDSPLWLGRAAWLDLELNDKKRIRVATFSRLDPETDDVPECPLPPEHWDGEAAEGPCPSWAAWMVSMSTDLADRAPGWIKGHKIKPANDDDDDDGDDGGHPETPPSAPARASRPASASAPRPPATAMASSKVRAQNDDDDDDDDIPF